MIRSFKCRDTERLHQRQPCRRFANIERSARKKLAMLDAAEALMDLRVARLESLKGDRKGQYSIRINDQWRICFTWEAGRADHVEIVDYH